MGVQRQERAEPPIPGARRSSGSEPNSKTINTLTLSCFPSISCQENPAKVLIPIDRVGKGHPNYQPVNTPRSQKTPKNPSCHHAIEKFIFRRTNGEPGAARCALNRSRGLRLYTYKIVILRPRFILTFYHYLTQALHRVLTVASPFISRARIVTVTSLSDAS
jgi:hypothetical protein